MVFTLKRFLSVMGPGPIISSISMRKKQWSFPISEMQWTQNTIPKALATYLQSSWDEMKKLDEEEGSCVHLGVRKLWMLEWYIKKQRCIVKQLAGCELYRRLYLEITLLCEYECAQRHAILSPLYALMTHYLCMGIPRWNLYRSAVSNQPFLYWYSHSTWPHRCLAPVATFLDPGCAVRVFGPLHIKARTKSCASHMGHPPMTVAHSIACNEQRWVGEKTRSIPSLTQLSGAKNEFLLTVRLLES